MQRHPICRDQAPRCVKAELSGCGGRRAIYWAPAAATEGSNFFGPGASVAADAAADAGADEEEEEDDDDDDDADDDDDDDDDDGNP